MTPPLVTIGIACFNAEATIARAVLSALKQDWPALEVLVVDDGSGDGSAAVVEALIAGEPRARLVRHAGNRGAAAARNTVLLEARGALIAFFDDDDESLPGRLAGQVSLIEATEAEIGDAPLACFASGTRRYPNGYELDLPAIGSRGAQTPHGRAVADHLLFFDRRPGWFYGAGTPACALMLRARTLAALGGFDEDLRRVEDADLAIRLALSGGYFIGTSERLFVQHATESPDKSPDRNLEAEQRLAEKNAAYLKARRRYYYARHWPRLRYWHFRRRYDRLLIQLLGLLARNPIAVVRHLLATGPRRLGHERRMRTRSEVRTANS